MSLKAYISTIPATLCLCLGALAQSSPALPAASLSASTPDVTHNSVATVPDYEIGADDILAINVWKEPDLCRTVPVRPDGKITLPLIGDVQASGKTPRKLQQDIQESLTAFVAVPDVTVIVQEVKS